MSDRWDFKGIFFFYSFYRGIPRSILKCPVINWTNWMIHPNRKRPGMTNRRGLVFHCDDGRVRISMVTRQKLLQLLWDEQQYPPYSPDQAPSDYYLLRSLQNVLDGNKFTCNNDGKMIWISFLSAKIYECGIMKLPERL